MIGMFDELNIRSTVSFALALLLLGSLWGVAIFNWRSTYHLHEPPSDPTPLKRFSSEDELRAFLNRSYPGGAIFHGPLDWQILRGPISLGQALSAKMPAIPGAPEHSGTNIQVEGIEEADLVKTDGRYLYISSNSSIVIVRAYPPESARVLSSIPLNRSVGEIFLNGDKLAVFLLERPPRYILTSRRLIAPRFEASTIVKIFDISDRSHPVEERSIEVDGYYMSSRMIGEYIYLVTIQPAYLKDGEVVTPKIRTRELVVTIPLNSIYYANYTDSSYAYTNIFSMSILDPGRPLNHESFLVGASSCIYVSPSHIYITVPRYEQLTGGVEEASIYKIRIDDGKITYMAGGKVPGWVLNQFSMDEFNGYFRIATTMGRYRGEAVRLRNNVYILNSSLGIVGRLEELAPGEEIYSARFMGSRCYLVTFKKVDPLFVLDLSSPTNPKVLGKLKIPGYSNYLHPYGEGHLIGIGKETVEAEGGGFAWYQGVKISLFDVSDVENPKELAKYTVGDRGTSSPVLRDHKALLFIKSRSMLVLPILEARINPRAYPGGVPPNAQGDYVYQGAYIFRVSLEGGIELLGRITHMDGVDDLAKSGLYFKSPYSVKRALYIEDTIYTISDRMIKMNSLETLKEINRVILPQQH